MDQMGWFTWLVIGALAGWLSSTLMRSSNSQGLLINILIGIAGAFIGGFLFNLFGAASATGFNVGGVIVSFIGAAALLVVIRLLSGRRLVS